MKSDQQQRSDAMHESSRAALNAVAGLRSDDAAKALVLAAAVLARLSGANHKAWKTVTEQAWDRVPAAADLLGQAKAAVSDRMSVFAAALEAIRAVFR
jgi:hypothetical protein